jgi:NADPH:quinone reductase-like Zn-dependent oxidoreductase
MKAVVYDQYGPPDMLRLEDVPRPIPRDNEVLVRVLASSINSWDWDLLTGTIQGRIGGFRRPRYAILGADVAGRIEAVGTAVTRFAVGDEV